MKKRMIAIAAATMATMMMATPVLAEDYKIGICNYVDDASLNQIVDNLESRLKEIGDEKGVNFDISYDNCNADANVMEQIISDFQADGVDLDGWRCNTGSYAYAGKLQKELTRRLYSPQYRIRLVQVL
ncbi:MAG: hypothetical protein ACLURP_11555 [Ruminococcus sp.]